MKRVKKWFDIPASQIQTFRISRKTKITFVARGLQFFTQLKPIRFFEKYGEDVLETDKPIKVFRYVYE